MRATIVDAIGCVIAVGLGVWFMTGRVLRYVQRKNILDHPNGRSAHAIPTPRGGGVAIVFVSVIATTVAVLVGWLERPTGIALVVGGSLVAWVGWQDDKGHVAPRWRAAVHFAAASMAVYLLGGFPAMRLGTSTLSLGIVGPIVAILGIVWAINFYNFMDGIDGIASIEGLMVGCFAAVLLGITGPRGLLFPAAIIAAACAGFLPWNWSPAKIFMGDAGSGFLGYWFAVLAISSENRQGPPVLLWALLLSVFIFDATVTLVIRLFRGERVAVAHREHAYQRAVQSGLSHARVSSIVGLLTAVAGCAAVITIYARYSTVIVTLAATIGLAITYYAVLARAKTD